MVFSPQWVCKEGKTEFHSMKGHSYVMHDNHHTKEAINCLTHEIFIAFAVCIILHFLIDKHQNEVRWMYEHYHDSLAKSRLNECTRYLFLYGQLNARSDR